MSYQRSTRQRVMNYTPSYYQQQAPAPSQPLYPSHYYRNTPYQPTQQQIEEEESALIPKPIAVPSLQEQDQYYVNKLTSNRVPGQHHYATNFNGSGNTGSSLKKRIEMGFQSGIKLEIEYSLRSLTEFSYFNPALFLFKQNTSVLNQLIGYLDCTKLILPESMAPELATTNDDLQLSLDAALSLRNFSQVIENSAIMSANIQLKEILIKILNSTVENGVGSDEYELIIELRIYALDIVESISSYMSFAPKDDPLFCSLLSILSSTEDRSLIVSVLRSMSRLLIRTSTDAPSSADNISEDVLDQISSYLLISSPLSIPDPGNDELLLASLDFIYQYCLAGEERVTKLILSYERAKLLSTVLPKLLTHGITDVPSEVVDAVKSNRSLKLIRRVKRQVPNKIPILDELLLNEINEFEEPERATAWMRCCYEPSEKEEVTQISLWKAYEAQFSVPKDAQTENYKKLLPAVDFIKNVSNAFPHSSAKVIHLDNEGSRRFVITGIQPRPFALSVEIGNIDAQKSPDLTDPDTDDEDEVIEDVDHSEQRPFDLVNYGDNEKIGLNEINTSSALLMNSIVKTEQGYRLFSGKKDELLSKAMVLPALFSHIYESLDYLDY